MKLVKNKPQRKQKQSSPPLVGEWATLDNLAFGEFCPEDVLFVRLTNGSENFKRGDVAVIRKSLAPISTDLILWKRGDDHGFQTFSTLPRMPLQLASRNGETIKIEPPDQSFEIVGVVTHILKTLIAAE